MPADWLPIAAGVGVLGLTVAGVIAIREPEPEPAARLPANLAAPQPDDVAASEVEFTTSPADATVLRFAADAYSDATRVTGHSVTIPRRERVVLAARRIGYREDRQVVTTATASPVRFHLTPIRGFVGTWRTADGELRTLGFAAETDVVIETREGATHALAMVAPEPDTGSVIELETHDTDVRGPDPSCQFALAVRYRFDASRNELERREEILTSEIHDGRCVAAQRGWGNPVRLERVPEH